MVDDDLHIRSRQTRMLALFGVAARVINAGAMFVAQVLFARALGASEYGIVSAAMTLMLVVSAVASLGLTVMPQRFLPEYDASADREKARGLVRFALGAPALIGLAVAGLAVLMLLAAEPWLGRPVVMAACLALLTVPAQGLIDVVEGVALARGWKGIAYGFGFVMRPLLVPVLFGALWLSGASLDAVSALIAVIAATWIAAVALVIMVGRVLRRTEPSGRSVYEPQRWIVACLPVMLIDGAFLLMTSTDIILLSVFRSDAEVGIYSAAARLIALVAFVHQGLAWASGHHFSALHQSGDRAALAAYAQRTTLWTFLPSVAVAAGVALAAPLLLLVFGKDFGSGGPVTALLLLGLLARAAVGSAEQVLVMTDHQGDCAKAYGAAFLVNLLLGLWLVPWLGGIGAALSTVAAYAVAALLLALSVRQRLGFDIHVLAALLRTRTGAAHA